ncbi:predicted protein [Histoplasma capsulatum H143]|uniref:Uncharacterized protein n=1 Tax=Ajellomyces capsulatus (strain H143) TaxID=544712 RepID=C6H6G6_AJECH|nr:predicted protein [Histoplasma capsulatum H143]
MAKKSTQGVVVPSTVLAWFTTGMVAAGIGQRAGCRKTLSRSRLRGAIPSQPLSALMFRWASWFTKHGRSTGTQQRREGAGAGKPRSSRGHNLSESSSTFQFPPLIASGYLFTPTAVSQRTVLVLNPDSDSRYATRKLKGTGAEDDASCILSGAVFWRHRGASWASGAQGSHGLALRAL